ncbi:MAG: hypothetical protein KTU85_09345 [Acidimicrobiia bacterium]|nr:hypothetical protein [Acidimicrobiia bacterium]MCY4456968.1 hypothetical protein [Acidimicrobiaceae bacterium]
MAQLGADVEQLDVLSRKFDEEAQKIEATISVIASQIEGIWWQGPDADRFCNDWRTVDTIALRQVVQRLQTAATDCRSQAAQQRQVSQT